MKHLEQTEKDVLYCVLKIVRKTKYYVQGQFCRTDAKSQISVVQKVRTTMEIFALATAQTNVMKMNLVVLTPVTQIMVVNMLRYVLQNRTIIMGILVHISNVP